MRTVAPPPAPPAAPAPGARRPPTGPPAARPAGERRHGRRRRAALGTAAVGAGLLLVLGPGPAAAHVEAEPTSVEAGSPTTISLGWRHGCGGSPTRAVSVRLPAGAGEVVLLPPAGWDAAGPDAAGVATFTARPGAEVADGAAGSVGIELRVPDVPDGRLVLPTVQTCVQGEEPWVEEPVGDEEPERPAPTVAVVASTAGAAASHETEDDEHTTTTVQVAPNAVAEEGGTATVDGEAAATDADGGGASRAPLVVGGLVGVAVGVATGLVLQRRRRAR